ncbi:MAG: hypothetical protein ACYSWZ_02940 [Planctomycetota bacterium]|jgi:hypothetical protein
MAGLGIEIEKKLSDELAKQVEERGQTKYRAVEGAIRAWLALPKVVQVDLMSKNVNAHQLLMDTFQNIALQEYLEKLNPAQRNLLLATVKELGEKFSNKK